MKTYNLKHPFTVTRPSTKGDPEEKEITSVTIPKRLKAKHMRGMRVSEGEMSAALDIVGAIEDLSPAEMDKMDFEDVIEIMGKLPISEMLSQVTGKKS